MDKKDILQSVKKKIYAVCPEKFCKMYPANAEMYCQCEACGKVEYLNLPEVLRAIEATETKGLLSPRLKRRSELTNIQQAIDFWDLTKDLSGQSEEVIDFLFNLV